MRRQLTSDQKFFGPFCRLWHIFNQSKSHNDLVSIHLTADTLAKDCLAVMDEAGVDLKVFGAHSVRGAAASAHVDNGELLDEVMKTGDWQGNAFEMFYNRGSRPRVTIQHLVQTRNPEVEDTEVIHRSGTIEELSFYQRIKQEHNLPMVRKVDEQGKRLLIPDVNQDQMDKTQFCAFCFSAETDSLMWCDTCNVHFHATCVWSDKGQITRQKEFVEWAKEGIFCEECNDKTTK